MIYVLYHANCYDGFGAAWAAWKALGETAEYRPCAYDDPKAFYPPEGAEVYLVDFTYPRHVIEDYMHRCSKLVILDHHKTAKETLLGEPFNVPDRKTNGVVFFDMESSGAVLAWEYFHPGKPVPDLIKYVEDRDLWRFALPNSKEVSAALRSYPFDFQTWDRFDVRLLAAEGVAILRHTDQTVEMICEKAHIGMVGGHEVPIVNATGFWSEIGHRLLQLYPDHPFAASWYENKDGRRVWSLRSRGDFDVGALAKSLGGGGHKAAAGFLE